MDTFIKLKDEEDNRDEPSGEDGSNEPDESDYGKSQDSNDKYSVEGDEESPTKERESERPEAEEDEQGDNEPVDNEGGNNEVDGGEEPYNDEEDSILDRRIEKRVGSDNSLTDFKTPLKESFGGLKNAVKTANEAGKKSPVNSYANTGAGTGQMRVEKGEHGEKATAGGSRMSNEAIKTEKDSQNMKGYQIDAEHSMDAELEMLLSKQRASIKIVGSGGAGNNTINRISEVGIVGAETIAVNTDAQDLLYTSADKKILIGKEITGGLGAGSIPKIGEEAARENEHELKSALTGADMIFITCGLGGGTGTGSTPVIAEVAKKVGALTVGIVTMPFSMEGHRRYENAVVGLEKLESIVDTLIVIPNDKLLELAPDLPMQTAFKVADEILTNAAKGIAELVTKAGLVNLDFADIRAVMGKGGVALIGVGESDSENRAKEAVEKAIENPLLDVDISGANGALINVIGGNDMTLEEARQVVETVSNRLDEDARIIWGAQISEDMDRTIRAMLIVTGVKSSQIFGKTRRKSDNTKAEIESELGIEFID